MCDCRFPLCAKDLCVQVHQAARYRRRHRQALLRLHGNPLQVIVQRTVLMVMGDEPQLGAGVARSHIRRHEAWEERQSNMSHRIRERLQTVSFILRPQNSFIPTEINVLFVPAFNIDFVCYDHDRFMLGSSYLGVRQQETTNMRTGSFDFKYSNIFVSLCD